MKLMRIGPEGAERPALLADGGVVLDPPRLTPDDGAFLAAGGIDGPPAGVALGLPGNPCLRPGDLVELEITGLGAQTQTLAEA